MTDRRLAGGVCAVVALALALRLGPLYWSPLPFNPDGVGYATLARDALATGGFPLAEMATDQVGYTALLAVVSALTGGQPLVAAQPASAVVGASSILVGVLLARRLALGVGWSANRATSAALLAGLLLSLEGVYLYRSMPTDEQTAGFLLVPAFVLAVDRWFTTSRRSWVVIGAVLLAPIPPLHNLTGLVASVAVAVVAVVAVVREPTRPTVRRAVGATVGTGMFVFGYHLVVAQGTPLRIVQSERLLRVPDLFVAWVILAAVGAAWYLTTSQRVRRASVITVLLALFGLVALNAVRPVFPSTTATSSALLVRLLPVAFLAIVAGLAAHVAPRNDRVGATTIALVAAPLAVVGTGLTARLTFDYLALIFRAHLFIHIPLLALVGVGTVLLAERASERVGAGVVVLVVASAAVTAPIAYAGLDLLSYKSVTTEAEFGATGYAADELDAWTTDDHLARLTSYHDGSGGGRGPTFRWLRGDEPPPNCPVLAQRSWTTTGAQFYPQSPARLSPDAYRTWRGANDVVYVAISDDPISLVAPRTNTTGGC
ncbi:hypothetical protein [Halosimplex amylolyticum]|uniref:hypothetical protein n=1 Tax=Halosimplex amylolyticum TaxID=3396616 RepID=UPI003F564E83